MVKFSDTGIYKSATGLITKIGEMKTLPKYECSFSHPMEGSFVELLNNSYLRTVLNKVVEKQYADKIEALYSGGIKIKSKSHPFVYHILKTCSDRLNLNEIPNLIITNELHGINALTLGSDHFSFIALSRGATVWLNEQELLFLIGHECGHIIQNNLSVHTIYGTLESSKISSPVLSSMVSDLIEVPINYWHRCSEITADRAGLICCRDLETGKRMLIGADISFDFESISNWDDYSRKYIDNHKNDIKQNYFEIGNKHPMTTKRVEALDTFMNFMNLGLKKTEIWTNIHLLNIDNDLNKRIELLVKENV